MQIKPFQLLVLLLILSGCDSHPVCDPAIEYIQHADVETIQICAEHNAVYQNYLGNLYREGEKLTRDYAQALAWYKKAADNGYVAAMFNLGNMYRLGMGLTKNDERAVSWYTKAAKLGDTDAQINLGYMYSKGQGVDKSLIIAYAWIHLAYLSGDDNALINRSALMREMTESEIEQAEALSKKWSQTALAR